MDTVVAVPLPSCAHGLSHYHGRRGLLLGPPSLGTTSFSFVIPDILTPLNIRDNRRRTMQAQAFWKSKPEKPTSVPLEPIIEEDHLNTILSDAEQAGHAVIIDWMASWCRKCIYLKPKLEKIAAEFYPEIKFFYVDVNSVPKALVDRGGVSKMPTIQLWKNGKKEAEVIGGHKAWMVIDEIREMIKENH